MESVAAEMERASEPEPEPESEPEPAPRPTAASDDTAEAPPAQQQALAGGARIVPLRSSDP
jgi:hypothetical protein